LIGEDGANLLARSTPIAFIAKGEFWVNNHAHVLKTLQGIPLEFLSYFINSINLSPWITGTAQPKLNQAKMNKIQIPIPPLNEQRRIVSRLESIFSRIDACRGELERLAPKTKTSAGSLDALRSSVLKQAFEGRLVPQDPDDESAEALLKRINRDAKELVLENDDLPKGWVRTALHNISIKIHYGYTAKSTKNKIGPKYLRITDIQNNAVEWECVPYCSIIPKKLPDFILKPSDLVFARTGATVGKSFLITNPPEAVFASYLIRIILSEETSTHYVNYFFKSSLYWKQIRAGNIGIAQPNFNASKLSKIQIPLPPLNEQKRIVSKIESIFSGIDAACLCVVLWWVLVAIRTPDRCAVLIAVFPSLSQTLGTALLSRPSCQTGHSPCLPA